MDVILFLHGAGSPYRETAQQRTDSGTSGLMPPQSEQSPWRTGTPFSSSGGPISYAPIAATQGGSGYVTAHRLGSSPDRSVNGAEGGGWLTRSDLAARQQSEGFRQGPCGIGSLLLGIRNAGQALIDTTQKISRELRQDWNKHWNSCHGLVDCLSYVPHSPTLNKTAYAVGKFIRQNPDVIIGMIPVIGDLYDLASGLIGQDLLTGRSLSSAEWGLALGAGLLGLFTGGDEVMGIFALFGRVAGNLSPAKAVSKGLGLVEKGLGALKTGAKALRQVGEAGLRQVDEVAQSLSRLGRNAGQAADEVAAAVVDAGRLADNADEAALSLSRMDELMGERRMFSQAETRAAFSGGSDGALSRRIEQNRLNNLSEFTNGNQAFKQGDDLREALTNSSRSGRLDKRIGAAQAWREMGADLNNPAIRRAINKGRGPIRGGSGAPDNFLAPVRDRLDTWVAQGRITSQEADEAIRAVEKYVPQNNALGRAIAERHGLIDGGKVNCHGFTLCVYPSDYKNQKPMAQYQNSDNYNAFGNDDFVYTDENGVKHVRPPEELAQMPDKIEILLKENFDEIKKRAVRSGDVVSWQGIVPVYSGAKIAKEEITHTGIYVQKNGDLVFSKLGPEKYLVLPRSVLDKLYGGNVRYWRLR